MKKGYTLIELLIVISVLMTILVLSVVTFYSLTKKTDLDTSRDNIISTLNKARNKTLASEGAAQYGVYFDDSSSPDRYIFFKGVSTSFDKIHDLPSAIEISDISFNGDTNEVVFNRLEGDTDNYGSVTIQSSATSETRTIYIYSSGKISIQSESGSGADRIIDSRHVHFNLAFGNLDWSIQNATTLKFDFVDAGQVETIDMVYYFNADKTKFDWRGEFIIEGAKQKYHVHTHFLDAFNTLLCIHRDGKNTKAVTVYIIDAGIDKEIAHYQADGTGIIGPYGGTKEEQ